MTIMLLIQNVKKSKFFNSVYLGYHQNIKIRIFRIARTIQKNFLEDGNITRDLKNDSWTKTLNKWFRDKGDIYNKITYDLTPESVVFDIGGYEGQWASDIYSKYNCTVYVFEPVSSFFHFMKNRFKKNKKIIPINYALGKKAENKYINVFNENSSTIKDYKQNSSKVEKIKFITFQQFYKRYKLDRIDLISINIEGGEYDLLDSIIQSKLISKIENIQVQFHRFVENHRALRNKLHRQLRKTHILTYNYPFVWESWKKIH